MWSGVFFLGLIAGFAFYKPLLPQMSPVIGIGLGAAANLAATGAVATALIIFGKNSCVALMCALLGRQSRGCVPLIVCAVNGVVVGFVAAFISHSVAPWEFMLMLAPHGVIELPAIFLACAVGMAAVGVRERLKLVRIPLALLVAAAIIETWVSPLVANKLLV